MTNEIDKGENLSNENGGTQHNGNDEPVTNEAASQESSENTEVVETTNDSDTVDVNEATAETEPSTETATEDKNQEEETSNSASVQTEEVAQTEVTETTTTAEASVTEDTTAVDTEAEVTNSSTDSNTPSDQSTASEETDAQPTEDQPQASDPTEASTEETVADQTPVSAASATEAKSEQEAEGDQAGETAVATEEEGSDATEGDKEAAEEEIPEPDYATLSKSELLEVAANLSRLDHFVKADSTLKVIAPLFNEIITKERKEALDRFLADGGDAADFSYRDEDQVKFDGYYKIIKERKSNYFNSLEKQKEENYQKKLEVLEKLREFVDSEENTTSINILKSLQEEYKAIGPIPGQHTQTLWANYHAIIDRFYDNRSIYFELKELDRKKNLKAKLALCEKAEELAKEEDFRKATAQLNELHDEFKHIGPIPRDHQELVWERFKTASDVVYSNRKSYLEKQKVVFEENLQKKLAVIEKVKAFAGFDSDRINDWNAKTKEILEVQKEWEAIGGIPREKAKSVNKEFWGIFKGFFHDKGAFFKKLESFRDENLKKKEELVEKAHAIKDSEDWAGTAEALKKLQREWKEIGPVPEKHRNEVYERFRAACDHFFNNKRGHDNETEKEFVENLDKKKAICQSIQELAKADELNPESVYELVDQYAEIGFVPRRDIKSIKNLFDKSIKMVLEGASNLSEEDVEELKINLKLSQLKSGPDANRKLHRKENTIKRKLSELEENVNLLAKQSAVLC